MPVFDSREILIDEFVGQLERAHARLFGATDPVFRNTIRTCGAMAMEIIANSDALYHNVEHSMLVTLVGQEVLRGKFLREGSVTSEDWIHVVVSLLCHDIGYVRGICPGDRDGEAVVDDTGRRVAIPPGATDAFLTPYHVERGKMFVRWRFRDHPLIDPEAIADNLEHTRFPVPVDREPRDGADYPGLIGAADLIGQLADPDYLAKLPALFHEFEETGTNAQLGAKTPDDLRDNYPKFFWDQVRPHIGPALRYLRATRQGRRWEAGLYTHVFSEEHRRLL